MSVITEIVTAGSQFAYTTAFADMRTAQTKVRASTVGFYTSGTITSWSLDLVDPDGNTCAVILAGTSASFYADSIEPLPVTDAGVSYQIKFTTVGMVAEGRLTISHQVVLTGAT